MKTPFDAANLNPEEMLEMLRFQAEIGVDECLLDEPASGLVSEKAAEPPQEVVSASEEAVSATLSPEKSSPKQPQPSMLNAPRWQDAADLAELRGMVEGFNGSDLKKTASNMVFADGNPEAEIMLIGEAPGADEDRQGKPFVGVSGQLLDKMLASIRLDRNSVYISNILPWRPPGNRTPTTEEVAMFLPMIKRHIELIAPKIVITLGGSSTKALLGTSEGILKLRGQWFDYGTGENNSGQNNSTIPMLAMLHPAYLLRTPAQKALAWKDLKALYRKAEALNLKFLADG